MTGLKLTFILLALLVALAIVAEARADVTGAPLAGTSAAGAPLAGTSGATTTVTGTSTSTSTTSAGSQNVSGPGTTEGSTPVGDSSSDPSPVDSAPVPVSVDPPPVGTAQPPAGQPPASAGPAPGSSSDPSPPSQDPSLPASGDQPTTAGGPTTDTSQVILQVQVSGCQSYCQGTSQTQAADQQNVTVQNVPPTGPSGPSTNQPTAVPQPQGSTHVTQIQVGCVHDCSDTGGDTTAPPVDPGTLSQLLSLLGSQPPAGQPPVTPGQSSVGQTSQQTQLGDGSGGDQSQLASQWSGTVQELVSQAVDQTVQVVNQTTQTIVQVQIGCLFHCTDTHQTQQASQTNTAVQVVGQGVSAATAPAATVVSTVVNQLVWQLQIGCLAWCSNTTQQQSASQSNQAVTIGPQAPDTPPAPPPSDPGPPTGTPNPGSPPAPADPGPAPSAPGPVPASSAVVSSKPSLGGTVVAPPITVWIGSSGRAVAEWAPATGIGGPPHGRGAPVGAAPATLSGAAATIVTVSSSATTATRRVHRAALRSSRSWQMQGIRLAPPAIAFTGSAPSRAESSGTGTVLAGVVALALGLLLLTAVRIRTR